MRGKDLSATVTLSDKRVFVTLTRWVAPTLRPQKRCLRVTEAGQVSSVRSTRGFRTKTSHLPQLSLTSSYAPMLHRYSVSSVEYVFKPPKVRWPQAYGRETRLADCLLLSRWLGCGQRKFGGHVRGFTVGGNLVRIVWAQELNQLRYRKRRHAWRFLGASLADWGDQTRRSSKRQKDLLDIMRLVESHPELRTDLPPELEVQLAP